MKMLTLLAALLLASTVQASNIRKDEIRNTWLSSELTKIATATARARAVKTSEEAVEIVEFLDKKLIPKYDPLLVACLREFSENIEKIIPCMEDSLRTNSSKWAVVGPGMIRSSDITLTFERTKHWVYGKVTFGFESRLDNPTFYVDDEEIGYSQNSSYRFTYDSRVTEDLKKGRKLTVRQFGKNDKVYSLKGLTKAVNESI
ncbi:hypothetical protein EKG38_04890 [Shewanella canadensis]|uniref:Uncharacterized protein n=1 Tax=Shewanella canadensis TaxID=271096 RepID=A0A431WXD1_9GAMM|nr:hypothetical protein [Shewanella canadensis]RTR40068.1 hypothetical protein EKG38_04890 [Shewanella canadensis]